MIEPDAQIIVHERHNELDGQLECQSYEWVGGRIASLTHQQLRAARAPFVAPGAALRLGSLCLRVIDYDFYRQAAYVALDGRAARLLALFWPLTRWPQIIKSRLIITAVVWGLAKNNPAVVPSWQDIHILKTAAQMRRKWSEHVKRVMEK